MTEHDQKSIDEKFLESGDLFVLKYSNGYKFFEVETWKTLKFRPYDVGTVSAGSTQGFERLTDVNGDDILYVEQGDSLVLHASIGMSPASVRRYTNFPESENRLRTIPNLPNPSARNGDDYGFVDGEDSPFAFLDSFGDLDFAFTGQQGDLPHFTQIHADGVVALHVAGATGGFGAAGLFFGLRGFVLVGLVGVVDFDLAFLFDDLDAQLLEEDEHVVDLLTGEHIRGKGVVDFFVGKEALFFAHVDELLDFQAFGLCLNLSF